MATCTYTATLTRPLGDDTTGNLSLLFDNTSASGGINDYEDQNEIQTVLESIITSALATVDSATITSTTNSTSVIYSIEIVCDDTDNVPIGIWDTIPTFNAALFESDCFEDSRIPAEDSTCTYISTVTRPIGGDTTYTLDVFFSDSENIFQGDYSDPADLTAVETALNTLEGIDDAELTAEESGGNVTFTLSFVMNGSTTSAIPIGFYADGSTSIFTFTCVSNNTASDCPTCYKLNFEACSDELEFDLGLTADTDYIIRAKDNLQNIYKQTATSDEDGKLLYDTTADGIPSGLFNPFGTYEFTFRLASAPNTNVSFTIGDYNYSCVDATFQDVTDTTP